MKAYDVRNIYEETLYTCKCRRCGAEIEGELNEFKFISRIVVSCHCPACGAHNSSYIWKLHPKRIIKGVRQIEKLEV